MCRNLFVLLAISAICEAQSIQKFTAPYSGLGITAGPDGALWLTPSISSSSYAVGRITTDGKFSQIPLPAGYVPGGPIVTGPDGALWLQIVDNTDAAVVRLTTSGTYNVYAFDLTDGIYAMAVGPDGAIWLSEFDRIGRITTSGAYSYFSIGTYYPTGIAAGPDGNLWFPAISSVTGASVIGRITPAGVVTTFPLPGVVELFAINGITAGPDKAMWFTIDAAPGTEAPAVGRISTSGAISTFNIPNTSTFNFQESSIAASPDGGLWFTGNGAVGRITTNGTATVYPLPSDSWVTYAGYTGLGITAGPDGYMWFPVFGNNGIARAALGSSPVISQITPNSITAGSPATTLEITGSGLTGTTTAPCTGVPQTVTWNGTPLTIISAAAGEIDATVPASLLTTAGTYTVSVSVQQVSGTTCVSLVASGSVQVTSSSAGALGASPTSLSFSTPTGQVPAAQSIQVTSLAGTITYSINVSYTSSSPANWIDLSATSGSVSPGNPVSVTVSIASAVATFGPGTYTANVDVTAASGNPTIPVAVTLTVTQPAATTTTLTANPVSQSAGQPVTLSAKVTPSTATGMVAFLDGTTSLGSVALNAGTAALTTSTLATGSHTITASYGGDAGDAPSNSGPVAVTITNPNQPTIMSGGIVNAASYAIVNGAGAAVAPGSLVAIFTGPLAAQAASFSTASLPPSLSGVSVTFNNITAPMVTVSPAGAYPYVSAQVPFEVLPAGQSSANVQVVITVNNIASAPVMTPIVASAPGIFTIPPTGQGNAVLVNLSDYSVAAPSGSIPGMTTHPIARGQAAFFYVTGLGTLTPSVADGSGTCTASDNQCSADATPQVFVGGVPVGNIAFAGQAPGFPGVTQINFTIPDSAPTGDAVTLVVKSADGTVTSNSATIAVQ